MCRGGREDVVNRVFHEARGPMNDVSLVFPVVICQRVVGDLSATAGTHHGSIVDFPVATRDLRVPTTGRV